MKRLIDGDALYEKASDLEAQALDYTVKISNDEEKREEWIRWSAILAERTAFKHDVYDAPTIEPERKTGRWIPVMNGRGGHCCNRCNGYAPSYMNGEEHLSDFCPYCGADMRGESDG